MKIQGSQLRKQNVNDTFFSLVFNNSMTFKEIISDVRDG